LWKPGVIESVENDNHLCVVRFTHFNALEAIQFESIITTSKIHSWTIPYKSTSFVLDTSEQIENNNDDENAADNDVSSSLADMPSSSTDSPRLGNLGDWEKHTRVRNMKIDLIR
jgi:hypothetical protein